MRPSRNPLNIAIAGVLGSVAAFAVVGLAIALVTVDGISAEVAGGIAGGVLIVGVYAFAYLLYKSLGDGESGGNADPDRRENLEGSREDEQREGREGARENGDDRWGERARGKGREG